MVAINYSSQYYTLDFWKEYWRRLGAGDVLWAQDTPQANALKTYRAIPFAGTTVIVDRRGRIAYRDDGATSYEKYRELIEKFL